MKKFVSVFAITILIMLSAAHVLASTYLANTKSGIFHYSSCPTIKHPDAPHFVPYESAQECIDAGYRACQRCHP